VRVVAVCDACERTGGKARKARVKDERFYFASQEENGHISLLNTFPESNRPIVVLMTLW
jgi:hypothetical protein